MRNNSVPAYNFRTLGHVTVTQDILVTSDIPGNKLMQNKG